MHYGGNSLDEMEITIRLNRAVRQAYLCFTWPDWSRKLERLYGSPKRVTGRDGKITSAFWVLPFTAIRVRRPSKGRRWTAEERQAAADRLQRARFARGRPVNTAA